MAEKQNQGDELIHWVGDLFKNVPHVSAHVQEVLVKIAPILALVFGILGVIAGLAAVGLSPVALFGGPQASMVVLVSGACSIGSSVLMLMAYPKLTKHQYAGWKLLFWSEVVGVVSALLSLSAPSILGVIIGFYLLYEIKGRYK